MAAKTMRNLVAGSGTVSVTAGSTALTFSSAQSFKRGATIKLSGGQLFTIAEGQGTAWTARQKATATVSGSSFDASDTGAGRSRGSSGVLIPWALHTMYASYVDDAGNLDAYAYGDTLYSEGGLHPYTKDPAVGSFYATQAADSPSPLPDDRLRLLEGIVRGSAGTTFGNPDARLDNIESRLSPAILAGSSGINTLSGSATAYAPLICFGTLSSSAQGARTVMPRAGTIKNLAVVLGTAPGASKSWAVTVRKNGVDTALTVTISGASQTYALDSSHSFTVAAGDEVEIIQVPTGTPASTKMEWAVEFVAADAGDGGSFATLRDRGDA